jgi:hypothetical protein
MGLVPVSLREHTVDQLLRLCDIIDFKPVEMPVGLLQDLLGPVGDRPLSQPSLWPSDVSDDTTPVEFSLAFDESGQRAVRILGEAVAEEPSHPANIRAARRLLDSLAERFPISLDRFNAVQELFLPAWPQGKFVMWYSFIFRPNRRPGFKVYFNADVQGPDRASKLVAEALRRLGLDSAYEMVTEYALQRAGLDHFLFFALDLDDDPRSRVKIYIAHDDAGSKEVERASEALPGIDPVRIRDFCFVLGGGIETFTGRPLISSYSFTENTKDHPNNYSLYLPIRSYVRDDAVAYTRVQALMERLYPDLSDLERAVRAVSSRALREGVGLLAHVSLRLGPTGAGTTVYLSSEAYGGTHGVRRHG